MGCSDLASCCGSGSFQQGRTVPGEHGRDGHCDHRLAPSVLNGTNQDIFRYHYLFEYNQAGAPPIPAAVACEYTSAGTGGGDRAPLPSPSSAFSTVPPPAAAWSMKARLRSSVLASRLSSAPCPPSSSASAAAACRASLRDAVTSRQVSPASLARVSARNTAVLSRACAQRWWPVAPSAGVGGGGEPSTTLGRLSSRLSPFWCARNRRCSSSRSRFCSRSQQHIAGTHEAGAAAAYQLLDGRADRRVAVLELRQVLRQLARRRRHVLSHRQLREV